MTTAQVAPECCGAPNEFVSVEFARQRAIEGVRPVIGEEVVQLRAARGRVTAASVAALHAVPPFDQSAMDGYAVRARDIVSVPATLAVVARQVAGSAGKFDIPDGRAAVRIFTGAPIPRGFDTVVMQEQCRLRAGAIGIDAAPKVGQHVRLSGDDVRLGDLIVEENTLIDARHVALLAASGVAEVRVRRRLRVALLSTGNELREPHEDLAPGEVHDSNRIMLMSLLASDAIEVTDLGCLWDSEEGIARTIAEAARNFDVIISTGGVSVGEEDHVGAAVLAAGGSFGSLRASIKPGKPVSMGRIGSAILIALPGNPVSALVTFLWFARPILHQRMGLKPRLPRPVRAIAAFEGPRSPGRDEFVPVVVSGCDEDNRPVVEKCRAPGSARLSSLIGADGLARIPGHLFAIRRGDPISFYAFSSDFGL